MAVKKLMNTFFASLQEQNVSGFGSKIVNTPMGPFTWNDALNVWVNMNNGMVMNNISFQDSMAMMDYTSFDGDANITPTGIAYGTIPMVFGPTSYNITSNAGPGSTASLSPTIQVPVGYPDFDVKWISNGGFGGTLSKFTLTRNRAGTIVTSPMNENTATPPIPGLNLFAGDLLTFTVGAVGVNVLGTETYTLYFYDQAGVTLSNQITVNVNIPANPNPNIQGNWGNLTNIPDGATAYWSSQAGPLVFDSASPAPSNVTFNLNTTIIVTLAEQKSLASLDNLSQIYYAMNNDPPTLYTPGTGITMINQDSLKIGAVIPAVSLNGGNGNIIVTNVSDSSAILDSIPYSFDPS